MRKRLSRTEVSEKIYIKKFKQKKAPCKRNIKKVRYILEIYTRRLREALYGVFTGKEILRNSVNSFIYAYKKNIEKETQTK